MRSWFVCWHWQLVPAVFAQPDAQLAFEVASVSFRLRRTVARRGRSAAQADPTAPDPDPGGVARNLNLKNLLGMAEGLDFFQIEGPDWLFEPYFNIDAILPKGTTTKQFQEMIESLLKDRFRLASHREYRGRCRCFALWWSRRAARK